MNISLRVFLHKIRECVPVVLSVGLFFVLASAAAVHAGNSVTVTVGHQPLAVGWSIFGGYDLEKKCTPGTTATQTNHRDAWMNNGGTALRGTVSLPAPTIVGGPFTFSCIHASGSSDTASLIVNNCPSGKMWDPGTSSCVIPPSGPDLVSSNVGVTGTLKQGNTITLNAQVTNSGTMGTGAGFNDNFTYQLGGTSGVWNSFSGNTVPQAALGVGANSNDAASLSLSGINGQLYIQHCVDAVPAAGVIAESNEGNNCSVGGPYTVAPTQCSDSVDNDSLQGTDMSDPDCTTPDDDDESGSGGSCTGSIPADATLCSGDDTGLSGSVSRTAVSSCTVATKCEYQCSAGFTLSNTVPAKCISGSLTVNPGTVTSGLTTTVSWTTENTSSCNVSSSPSAGSWTGTSNSGVASNPLTSDTTFTLECDGVPLDAETVVVDAIAPPVLNANPRVIPPNTDVTLTWDTNNTNEALCTLTGGGLTPNPLDPDGDGLPVGDPEQGSQTVTVTRTTTYTLTCPTGTDTIKITVLGSGFET